jgi:cell division protein FtsL
MSQIAIAARTHRSSLGSPGERELLGVKRAPIRGTVHSNVRGVATTVARPEPSETTPTKTAPSEIEKIVRKIPTIYVIAFFGVVVFCAVAIIWNTLQVNRLTLERNQLDEQITQTEQRLIRLRADEMQLSAPSRIREVATQKLGMNEATADEIIEVR